MSLAVAILAGGKSDRMGRDKSLLNIGGVPMLKHIIDISNCISQERLIVSNTPNMHNSFGWPIVSDSYKNKGPLGGLYTALNCIKSDRLLLLACDMPYLRTDFLHYITKIYTEKDAVVPYCDTPQPLCAVYKTTLVGKIEALINQQQLSMQYFLKKIDVVQVLADQWSHIEGHNKFFANINTPTDYATIKNKFPSTSFLN
jgi:molybdopterin-guanine dinucleotide biosynthesis protein A